jgi:hypothetical protein
MYSKLATALTLVALAVAAGACGRSDAIKEHQTFCEAREALYKVEDQGTVGEFGPALRNFAEAVPDGVPGELSRTADTMTSTWDELYETYAQSGGNPDVKLEDDGEIPPEIAGMNAEWVRGLDMAQVKKLYTYADDECASSPEDEE